MVTAPGIVRFEDQEVDASVELSPDAIEVRGPLRLRIALDRIRAIEAMGSRLIVDSSRGRVELELPDDVTAAAWLDRIRNPRSLLDKLGVRPGMLVAVIGLDDPAFVERLGALTPQVTVGAPAADADLVFLRADDSGDLDVLHDLRGRIRPNGAIWVITPKGGAVRDVDVIAAAIATGLVDNKVVAFSPTLTALRLVIRLRDRAIQKPD